MCVLLILDGMIVIFDCIGCVQMYVVLSVLEMGVVSELNVCDGVMVVFGQMFVKIVGLVMLWLIVEVLEVFVLNVQLGMLVDVMFVGDLVWYFSGCICEVLFGISMGSCMLQVCVEIDNVLLKFMFGMLMCVWVVVKEMVLCLFVLFEVVIVIGWCMIVIVKFGDGWFQLVLVMVGNDVGGDMEVFGGLNEGDMVVVLGQFLIDLEVSLKSVLLWLEWVVGVSLVVLFVMVSVLVYEIIGKVEKVMFDDIMFLYQLVLVFGWGVMMMVFGKLLVYVFLDVKLGQIVCFVFIQVDDGYWLMKVELQGGE